MTTFEITIIVLLAAIVMLLAWHCTLTRNNYSLNQTKELKRQQDFERLVSQLYGIKTEVGQTNGRIDGFIPAFKKLLEHNESIENFWAADSSLVIRLLKEIRNSLTQDINWGELTDGQKSEILYRLTHPVVESPFKPPFNPTCETTNKDD